MTGATLKKKLTSLYGKNFHATVAKECGVNDVTVYRWCKAAKVSGLVVAWLKEKTSDKPRRDLPANPSDTRFVRFEDLA